MTSHLSKRKLKKLFYHHHKLYLKYQHKLSDKAKQEYRSLLEELDYTIFDNQPLKHPDIQKALGTFEKTHLKKGGTYYVLEWIVTLVIAVFLAIIIRQMWFELYIIPTGSMRPTYQENDLLFVSKTAYGLNIPLKPDQFYFNPDLVHRGDIVVFTSEGMDVRDQDDYFLKIFPTKKQLIKRLIGKSGDLLYFYGGKVYGIDAHGNDISQDYENLWKSGRTYVPFIHFEGKLASSHSSSLQNFIFHQMNQPIGKIELKYPHSMKSYSMIENTWTLLNFSNFFTDRFFHRWGLDEYGVARLISINQATSLNVTSSSSDTIAYLQIHHHPSLLWPKPTLVEDYQHSIRPLLNPSSSFIALNQTHLERLLKHMTTVRFVIQNGYAFRYNQNGTYTVKPLLTPTIKNIPDGTYEFYNGVGYQVFFAGIRKKIPVSHPLYTPTLENVELLFNLGIEWLKPFMPNPGKETFFPSRYAYFEQGNLMISGFPIFYREEATLKKFIVEEKEKEYENRYYLPFIDHSEIFMHNSLNINFIKKYGLRVPENHYLVLGDNFASSADSRDFGFVPQKNIRGAPIFNLWPLEKRWGWVEQNKHLFQFNRAQMIIWAVVALAILSIIVYNKTRKYRNRLLR